MNNPSIIVSLGSQNSQTTTTSAFSAPWKCREQLKPALLKSYCHGYVRYLHRPAPKSAPASALNKRHRKICAKCLKKIPKHKYFHLVKDNLAPVLSKTPHGLQWIWRTGGPGKNADSQFPQTSWWSESNRFVQKDFWQSRFVGKKYSSKSIY